MRPSRPRAAATWALAAAALALAAAVLAATSAGDLAELFRTGRYQEARQAAAGREAPPGSLIPFLLLQDPPAALQAARVGLRGDPPPNVQTRLRLEAAWIEFSRGRYQEAVTWLEPLFAKTRELPGETHLLAGLAYGALGQTQRAREEMAAVKPDDPAFVWARYHLGATALEAGDPALALRYFESAERSNLAPRLPLLQLGRWQALRAQGQEQQAQAVAARIERDFPGSLAAMTVREAVAEPPVRAAPEAASRPALEPGPSPAARGRYALQLAAFGDRAHALSFLAKWQEQMPELQVIEDEDAAGGILYRIRLGPFATRAEAQVAAERLRRVHQLEVLVTEAR